MATRKDIPIRTETWEHWAERLTTALTKRHDDDLRRRAVGRRIGETDWQVLATDGCRVVLKRGIADLSDQPPITSSQMRWATEDLPQFHGIAVPVPSLQRALALARAAWSGDLNSRRRAVMARLRVGNFMHLFVETTAPDLVETCARLDLLPGNYGECGAYVNAQWFAEMLGPGPMRMVLPRMIHGCIDITLPIYVEPWDADTRRALGLRVVLAQMTPYHVSYRSFTPQTYTAGAPTHV